MEFDLGVGAPTLPPALKYITAPSEMDLSAILPIFETAMSRGGSFLEHEVYAVLNHFGLELPWYRFVPAEEDPATIHFPENRFVVKAVLSGVTHKTDIGALTFKHTQENVGAAVTAMKTKFECDYEYLGSLVVEMMPLEDSFGSELLISSFRDPFFGPCIAVGLGGTTVEYMKKVMLPGRAQALIPAAVDVETIRHVIETLPAVAAVTGDVRGLKALTTKDRIIDVLKAFQRIALCFSEANPNAPFFIDELEVNPAAVLADGRIMALDGVMHISSSSPQLPPKPLHRIEQLLRPQSAILVGASAKNSLNPCSVIMTQLQKAGVPFEEMLAVHPVATEIRGVRAVPTISAAIEERGGQPADLLVVGVPAEHAAGVVNEAIEQFAAQAVLIISAGFAETEHGKERAGLLKAKLREISMTKPERRPVLNGPNTLGCIADEYSTVFVPPWKSSRTGKGHRNVSLICQSGGLMISRLSNFANVICPSTCVSVGNQMDLSVTDFFEHLLETETETDAFGLYIEGLNDGDGIRLMELITKAQSMGKSVAVYKAGRSAQGLEAAKGHTASMAGDYAMIGQLLHLAGGIVCRTLREFEEVLMCLSCWGNIQRFTTNKDAITIGAISNAGFEKCALADHMFAREYPWLRLASWSDATRAKITATFEKYRIAAVVDIGDVLDVTPSLNDEGTAEVVEAMLAEPDLDVCFFATVPETIALKTLPPDPESPLPEDFLAPESVLPRFIEMMERYPDKLFVVSIDSGIRYAPFRDHCIANRIPCFIEADVGSRVVELVLGSLRRH